MGRLAGRESRAARRHGQRGGPLSWEEAPTLDPDASRLTTPPRLSSMAPIVSLPFFAGGRRSGRCRPHAQELRLKLAAGRGAGDFDATTAIRRRSGPAAAVAAGAARAAPGPVGPGLSGLGGRFCSSTQDYTQPNTKTPLLYSRGSSRECTKLVIWCTVSYTHLTLPTKRIV